MGLNLATSPYKCLFYLPFPSSLTMSSSSRSLLVLAAATAAVFLLASSASAKKEASLNDKVAQLVDLSTKRSVIRLNGNKFRDYVRNAPRNYR